MARRSRSSSYYYPSYYRQEKKRRVPSPLPYLVIAILAGAGLAYFHFFAYQTLSGKVTDAYTGAAMPGVVVAVRQMPTAAGTAVLTGTAPITATTGVDGSFMVERAPESPEISVEVEGYAPQQVPAAGRRHVEIKLVPSVLRGTVSGTDGKPLVATIIAGKTRTTSQADGAYVLKEIPNDRKLVVKSPGFLAKVVEFGAVVTQNITLEPFIARAVYINADTIATPGKLQGLLDLVDRTELNAVVIDVKADNSGLILYDSKLPLVQQMGTSQQIIPDLDGLLANLKSKKIYTIARLSVFWDQAATSARPEWALKSKKAPGQVWVDGYGKRWANPHNTEVWDYNIAIAREVRERGFDEVQFDNTQFPSDGELEDIDFGPQGAGKKRADAINGFLDRAYTELSPLGVYIGTNVFGLTPWVQDDMGVGQRFEDVAARTDYICPAIYPSLFSDGFMDFPKPAERPFDIVAETMQAATARLGGSAARVRPWLQDFSGKVQYDAPKVRAEIDGAEQNGAAGWMLWNFGNTYTEAALKAP